MQMINAISSAIAIIIALETMTEASEEGSDVKTLLSVFMTLIESGATVIVIEHDLDVIRNAAYIVDMGPGGGAEGGRIVACGTPDDIRMNEESLTGKYI